MSSETRKLRVNLKLPKWVEERHLRIFAGIEEVAKKLKGKRWQIKVSRCNMCGRCCMDVPDNWRHGKAENGWCKNLIYYANEYRCGVDRPFFCCAGDHSDEEYCSIEWKEL